MVQNLLSDSCWCGLVLCMMSRIWRRKVPIVPYQKWAEQRRATKKRWQFWTPRSMIVNVDGIVFNHCNFHKHYMIIWTAGNFESSILEIQPQIYSRMGRYTNCYHKNNEAKYNQDSRHCHTEELPGPAAIPPTRRNNCLNFHVDYTNCKIS